MYPPVEDAVHGMSLSELFLLRIRFNEKGEGFLRNSLNGFLVFFDDDADALVPAPNGGSAVVADGEGSKLGSKFSKLVPVDDCGDILANNRFGDEASSRPFCFSNFFSSSRLRSFSSSKLKTGFSSEQMTN